MKNKRRVLLAFISFILLFLGLILYLLLAPKTIISSLINTYIMIPTIKYNDLFFVRILRNYGTDFLWSAAFTMVIQTIIWTKKKTSIYLVFCCFLGIVYELLQKVGLFPGTADIFDVIIYFLGCIFSIVIIRGGKLYEKE